MDAESHPHMTIRAAGARANICGTRTADHDWDATVEIEGGSESNPGCWEDDGYMIYCDHCTRCRLTRRRVRSIRTRREAVQYGIR